MAVTPTEDSLIVALDFEGICRIDVPLSGLADVHEGVHSIERTAQEDSLLVLFNTAISNLVIFVLSNNDFKLTKTCEYEGSVS